MSTDGVTSPVPVADGLFQTDPPALLAARCNACGTVRFPVRELCARCQSTDLTVFPLGGAGVVHTFTVVHHRPPGYQGDMPYAIGVVELNEGLRVASTLTAPAEDLSTIKIGAPAQFELLVIGTDEPLLSYAYRVGASA